MSGTSTVGGNELVGNWCRRRSELKFACGRLWARADLAFARSPGTANRNRSTELWREAQDKVTRKGGSDRFTKDTDLDRVDRLIVAERQSADEQAHGEPDAAKQRHAVDLKPARAARAHSDLECDSQTNAGEYAKLLAHEKPGGDAERN